VAVLSHSTTADHLFLGHRQHLRRRALEALTVTVSKPMLHEVVAEDDETAGLLEADPDDAVAEDEVLCVELALGTFVSVASVIVLVDPCEATTTTEVPI